MSRLFLLSVSNLKWNETLSSIPLFYFLFCLIGNCEGERNSFKKSSRNRFKAENSSERFTTKHSWRISKWKSENRNAWKPCETVGEAESRFDECLQEADEADRRAEASEGPHRSCQTIGVHRRRVRTYARLGSLTHCTVLYCTVLYCTVLYWTVWQYEWTAILWTSSSLKYLLHDKKSKNKKKIYSTVQLVLSSFICCYWWNQFYHVTVSPSK